MCLIYFLDNIAYMYTQLQPLKAKKQLAHIKDLLEMLLHL